MRFIDIYIEGISIRIELRGNSNYFFYIFYILIDMI